MEYTYIYTSCTYIQCMITKEHFHIFSVPNFSTAVQLQCMCYEYEEVKGNPMPCKQVMYMHMYICICWMLSSNQILSDFGSLLRAKKWVWLSETWIVKLPGNIQQNSFMTLIRGPFNHASHAPQLRSCNYYIPANMCQEAAFESHELCDHFFCEVFKICALNHFQCILQL